MPSFAKSSTFIHPTYNKFSRKQKLAWIKKKQIHYAKSEWLFGKKKRLKLKLKGLEIGKIGL